MLSDGRELGSSAQSSKIRRPVHIIAMYILLVLLVILLIATLVLAAVAVDLGVTNRNKIDEFSRSNLPSQMTSTSHSNTTSFAALSSLEGAVELEEVFDHLRQFQQLADSSGGSRMIGTPGFILTLDYIHTYLSRYSELVVKRDLFTTTPYWDILEIPILVTYIDDVVTSHSMGNDFYPMIFSKSADFATPARITVVENIACDDSDWRNSTPYPADQQSVVLIKRSRICIEENINLAIKYNVGGLLIYNDGIFPNGQAPFLVRVSENVTFPVLFLSYTLGHTLAQAAVNQTTSTSVTMQLLPWYVPSTVVENICAWTKTGDPTQTIVVGSHSDSVSSVAGVNDNGSGSAANLVLAATLARLYQSGYKKYPYRIKFCWWAAEEVGLLGSIHHVAMLKTSTIIGERVQDYLVYLNYDMLGSPNYMFGIYDGLTVDKNTTPPTAIPGSIRVTEIYRNWFNNHSLPWTNQDISKARSDQAPFLEAGVVVGGLFSGAEVLKSTAERNDYEIKLGQGRGGIAEVAYDSCYHKACDTIQNINTFGLEQMTKAAAYAVEYLGRVPDLKNWLYPTSQIRELEQTMKSEGRHLQKIDFVKAFYESHGMKVYEM